MSHHLLEDLNNLYVEVNQYENNEDFNDIVETVFSDLVYSLASEGYSAKGIVSYLSHTSEQEIIEYYLNIGQIENKVSEEYVQEQINLINEGLGTFLRILGGGALRGGKMFGRGAVTAAKSTGSTLKTAVKSGFPQASQKLSGAVSKIKGVVKSPAVKVGAGAVALGGAYGLGRMQGGQGLAKGPTSPTPTAAPAAPSGGGKGGAGPKGGGKPSASSAASVDKQYRDLIKQGKTAEAEKFGLEAWKKANPKLAARLNPDGTQKGTGESEMEKQAAELRKISATSPENEALRGSTALAGMASSPNKDKLLQSDIAQQSYNRVLNAPKPTPKKEEDKIKKAGEEYGKKAFEDTRDAYSIVLDYLISEGHADTISEAHYVMMQMDSEYIQSIVEMDFKIDPGAHRKMQRIEKATKLQQGSTGPESAAADSAVKRLGGSGVKLPPA